jgi:AICAR transformylase/IMP cyclohydrolase PurH
MTRLKAASRSLHMIVEEKRKVVETRKQRLDTLQLKLENLLYKQAHLEREISICKNLSTPYTSTVEKDMKMKLSTSVFSEEIWNFHESIIESMKQEKADRESMQVTLEQKQAELQKYGDALEKKRKFLEVDLPNQVQEIHKAASMTKKLFESASESDLAFELAEEFYRV